MLYYDTKEKTSRRYGIAAVAAYLVLWAVLMFVLKFTLIERETGEGILIDFGDTETGYGITDPDNDSMENMTSSNDITGDGDIEDILTQDQEEAPSVSPADNRSGDRRDERTDQRDNTTTERQVNQRALFPGRTTGSTSPSEGTTTGPGNQGSPDGAPQGSHDGTGAGAGGTGLDLAGRSVVGSLPQPVYGTNRGGRVVIEITVDSEGKVINAAFRANGSTTNNNELVNAALRAALQSRFNTIDSDRLQTGTITYNFRLQ